jgi:hypothetical protein
LSIADVACVRHDASIRGVTAQGLAGRPASSAVASSTIAAPPRDGRATRIRARRRAAKLAAITRIGEEVASHRAALLGALEALDRLVVEVAELRAEVEHW